MQGRESTVSFLSVLHIVELGTGVERVHLYPLPNMSERENGNLKDEKQICYELYHTICTWCI